MKQREMEQIFNEIYKGNKNFMTPDVEEYAQLGSRYIAELSCGTWIDKGFLFGVTVLVKHKDRWIKHDSLNKMLRSRKEMNQYISFLKNNIELVESLSIPECLMIIGTAEVAKSLDDIAKELLDIVEDVDSPHLDTDV